MKTKKNRMSITKEKSYTYRLTSSDLRRLEEVAEHSEETMPNVLRRLVRREHERLIREEESGV